MMNWSQIVKEFSACSNFVDHFLLVDFTERRFIMIVLDMSTLTTLYTANELFASHILSKFHHQLSLSLTLLRAHSD
jgi:hypothetical protein